MTPADDSWPHAHGHGLSAKGSTITKVHCRQDFGGEDLHVVPGAELIMARNERIDSSA